MIEHIGDGWVWKSFRVAHLVGNLLDFLDATVAKRPGCYIGWLPFWVMFLVFVVCSSALPFFARGIFKGIFLLRLRFHPSDIHCFAFSLSSYNFSSHDFWPYVSFLHLLDCTHKIPRKAAKSLQAARSGDLEEEDEGHELMKCHRFLGWTHLRQVFGLNYIRIKIYMADVNLPYTDLEFSFLSRPISLYSKIRKAPRKDSPFVAFQGSPPSIPIISWPLH